MVRGTVRKRLKRPLKKRSITDCLIGSIAINNDLAVITLDQHFKHLPGLNLVTID